MLIIRFATRSGALLLETPAQAETARRLLQQPATRRCPLLTHLLAALAHEVQA